MTPLHTHPIAALFPMLPDAELRELAKDIKANGLIHAIVMDGETLIDGRNRLAACEIAGVEPKFLKYTGNDVAAYIVGANLKRRHMDTSQRAMVAAKMANIAHGQVGGGHNRQTCKSASLVTQPQAAKLMNVSPRQVAAAKSVEKAAPELAEKVAKGEMTVHAAKKIINPPAPKTSLSLAERYTAETRPPDPLSGKIVLPMIDPEEDAMSETPTMAGLKRYWRMAKKRERRDFLAWCKEN